MLKDWSFKTHRQYVKLAKSVSFDSIYFEIERNFHIDGRKSHTKKYSILITKDNKETILYCEHDSSFNFRLTNKQMKYIDHVNCEVSLFNGVKNKNSFYYQIGINDILSNVFTDIPYCIYHLNKIEIPVGCFFLISSKNDTIINGNYFTLYKGYHDGYFYNNSTEEFDNYVRTHIYNIINTKTGLLEYAYSTKDIDGHKYETYTYIKHINHDKPSNCHEKLFQDDLYSTYTFHDEKNPPTSRISSDNTKIKKAVTYYPLVSLGNDTIKLRDENKWILLAFWSLNCESCIKQLNKFGYEKDSLGYRILENEGIEIIAINYSTDNMELLDNIANKTNSNDIIYSAKGLNAYISIPSLGYYYLISPDKKVVFKDYKLGDYSELLKAKEDYENKK